jgi:hypothetical protein
LCLRDQQWRDHRCGEVVIKDKHGWVLIFDCLC